MSYTGGFWVHPSVSGSGISAIVPKIVNYATIATWGVPVIISIVREVFFRPDIVDTYNVESAEPYVCFKTNGRLTWEGSLVWFSMPFLEKRLDLELAALLDRPSASDGRGQEALDAVDVRRVDQA